MARMHSRKKGKAKSRKPSDTAPAWTPYGDKEVQKLVLKYAKLGKDTSEIGIILRDSYGIGNVKSITKKKITSILNENKLSKELPEDLLNLMKKMVAVKQHLEKNRQDQTAKRGLLLTSSKIRRLIKYYKKSHRLPANWKFDQSRLKMYIE